LKIYFQVSAVSEFTARFFFFKKRVYGAGLLPQKQKKKEAARVAR